MDVFPPYQPLSAYPQPEQWDDWVEYEATAWPRKVEKHYFLVPTTCFNCEAACGLLAYVDKDSLEIRKFEGNPAHPASRGRNCAKGPATINQVKDPERILYPLKRKGPRGSGEFERTTWDEVLNDIAGRIRKALQENRRDEVVYHVGRPGHDGYMDRVLQSWGVDGHNSHTNICSSSARLGYELWQGHDRPSPDHARARFILLLSSHLETGHYFNPHAQRIIEAKMKGARVAAVDVRLSNTASQADYWISPWPGTEAAMLLAVVRLLLESDRVDHSFMRRWVNWQEYLRDHAKGEPETYENFVTHLKNLYAEYTPEFAAEECGISAEVIGRLADDIAGAGTAFASHVWRNAAAGNLGGWQVARALEFLHVLTGSVGTAGGLLPNGWNKFVPAPFSKPAPQKGWNELLWPAEYPLAHHEMSFLMPHMLKEGRGHVDVYFTRVYNPVWTNPDGGTWMEVLSDEKMVGLHAALTPVWSETALFADYVLPMGVGAERHDLQSQETHAGRWIGFRQPVLRVVAEKMGKPVRFTYEANPGEVWEEDEFWIELSWRIDPDGALGIRKHYESPYRPGEKITVGEYYRWIFENSVPGLPERAARENLTPMEFMRKYGAYQVPGETTLQHTRELSGKEQDGATPDADGVLRAASGQAVGVMVDGKAVAGFPTPSRRLEFYSTTLRDWKWPEFALPGYIRSHVHRSRLQPEKNEFVLVPTFRLPTLIHTRSGNAKWLNEISHRNPVWIHPQDAQRLGVRNGSLLRLSTDIGYFVNRAWVTEGMKPGVVACSHHLGRWTLFRDKGERWSAAQVELDRGDGTWMMRQKEGLKPFESSDPDSGRVWWSDAGVHQNLTFPVHPDPLSGMHCWHQKVTVEKAREGDRYADIFVDTRKSMEIFREWLKMTRPAPGPGNLRRPLWFPRPVKPEAAAYQMRGK
jgi:anaerobic selenocysteine-containing dehydrogenase